ncbi:hypothetical protein [Luteimonas sp. TWI1416]
MDQPFERVVDAGQVPPGIGVRRQRQPNEREQQSGAAHRDGDTSDINRHS